MNAILVFFLSTVIVACANHRSEWDSGSEMGTGFEVQRQEEQDDTFRYPHPEPRATTIK